MGSDRYCLRWNNHQNNLLGVFNQLLQEESLVDVTLACSEGHSIRAHKVVLSACSTYFQNLFLDHPTRHPIIILKDVRFAELRTIVEFMYKGEVNVDFRQLPTLLKTAESLCVKGLADMTSAPEFMDHAMAAATAATSASEPIALTLRRATPSPSSPQDLSRVASSPEDLTRAPASSASPTPPCTPTHSSPRHRPRVRSCSIASEPPDDGDDVSSVHSVQSGPSDMTINRNLLPIDMESPHHIMQPVQQEPLSLKKESVTSISEYDRERQIIEDTPSDFSAGSVRQLKDDLPSLESVYRLPPGFLLPTTTKTSSTISGGLSSGSSTPSMDQISVGSHSNPFLFPFHGIPILPPFLPGENPLSLYQLLQQQQQQHQHSLLAAAAAASVSASAAVPTFSSSPGDLQRSFIKCAICLAAFPNGWLLEQHTILQHSGQSVRRQSNASSSASSTETREEKPFQCDQCGQSYRYRSAYIKHREQNHRARLPADKLFTCDICGMQFRYLKSFKKHRLNHTLEMLQPPVSVSASVSVRKEPRPDPEGGESSQPPNLVSESQVSSSNEVEASDEGGGGGNGNKEDTVDSSKGEPTLFNLLRYPERQRERQLFACSFCSKTVRSKENLKLHVRKHTGERPFACLFCGRAFGGKSDLTRHVRIHTGERPYHCEMCGKCFARADYLSKHLTTHLHNSHNASRTTAAD